MLWVFLSPSKTTQFEAAKNSLFNLIETRPKLDDKVEKTIRKHLNLVNFGQNLSEESGEDSNELEGQRFVEKMILSKRIRLLQNILKKYMIELDH